VGAVGVRACPYMGRTTTTMAMDLDGGNAPGWSTQQTALPAHLHAAGGSRGTQLGQATTAPCRVRTFDAVLLNRSFPFRRLQIGPSMSSIVTYLSCLREGKKRDEEDHHVHGQ
jgi:hypothetical protein